MATIDEVMAELAAIKQMLAQLLDRQSQRSSSARERGKMGAAARYGRAKTPKPVATRKPEPDAIGDPFARPVRPALPAYDRSAIDADKNAMAARFLADGQPRRKA